VTGLVVPEGEGQRSGHDCKGCAAVNALKAYQAEGPPELLAEAAYDVIEEPQNRAAPGKVIDRPIGYRGGKERLIHRDDKPQISQIHHTSRHAEPEESFPMIQVEADRGCSERVLSHEQVHAPTQQPVLDGPQVPTVDPL